MATNEEIIAEFEELFGDDSTEEPENEEPETEDTSEDTEDDIEDSEDREGEGEDTEDDPEDSEDDARDDEDKKNSSKDKQKARQNFEFARLRTENKKQANLLKSLGKVLGMDPKATPDQVAEKVQEILIQKEAKDKNVPVDLLQRMQELENIAAENSRIKLENETQKAFTNLAEKYKLDSDALTEFAVYLGENGKNPLEGVDVDIEAEYIKLHHDDIVQAAVSAALEAESKRKKKVEDHAGSKLPGDPSDQDNGKDKIETVEDLDKFFANASL